MYIVIALILLDILVIVHEGGHFWAARLCGIEVQEYAIGMGPLLLQHTTKRDTKISLRLLPIGGFCSFYDEEGTENDPRAFPNAAVWKRAITVAAGPVMNFVAAFLAIIIYMSVIGLYSVTNHVAAVEENAANAGMKSGDVIISVNGTSVESAQEISAAITGSDGSDIDLVVTRGDETVDLTISPFFDEELNRYRLGFTFDQVRQRVGLLTSIPFSFSYNAESATLIVKTLQGLVTQGEGVDDVTGPVGTVYLISEITREGGIDMFFELLALISVNLGIMNLLPIPGLDGSRLLFLLVEAIRRKPVKPEMEAKIHFAGFVFLMALMVLLTYKDLIRIFTTGFY